MYDEPEVIARSAQELVGDLNPQQAEAVQYRGQALLIGAGAGSGKTTVLVNRIANIIRFGRAYGSKEVSRPVAQSDLEQLRTAIMCGQPVPQSLICLLYTSPSPRDRG